MRHAAREFRRIGDSLKEILPQGGTTMERVTRSLATAALLAFAVCPSLLGHTKHAPLPEQILQAKIICLMNQTQIASLGDRAFDELMNWGRFKIVQKPEDADLVLVLSATSTVTGFDTHTSGNTTGTVDDSGNVELSGQSTSRSRARTVSYTYLTAIDPKTGIHLWSDVKQWGSLLYPVSATRSLVKELRKRIEEQEAGAKGKGK